MLDIYIDADGCPVKEEAYRVGGRHGLMIYVVSNRFMRVPQVHHIRQIVVGDAPDAADDWIAERAGAGDVVVTADIPLAARSLEKGAVVLGTKGRPFTEDSIGAALATRELMERLREQGEVTGGPAPMGKGDRSRFLAALEEMVRDQKRRHGEGGEG